MTHATRKTETMKTMTAPQMSWNLKRGYTWESPSNNGGLGDEFITREFIYVWEPPHLEVSGGPVVEGRFVAIG